MKNKSFILLIGLIGLATSCNMFDEEFLDSWFDESTKEFKSSEWDAVQPNVFAVLGELNTEPKDRLFPDIGELFYADKDETAGKRIASRRAGDRDFTVLKGLAERFGHVPRELRQLIEEENTMMRKGDLAGLRHLPAADERSDAHGMVRGTERTDADESFFAEHPGDGVDLRRLDGFREGQGRENGRHTLGQHGLARTGCADHQHVMTARGGDLQRAPGALLTFDILVIQPFGQGKEIRHGRFDGNKRDPA